MLKVIYIHKESIFLRNATTYDSNIVNDEQNSKSIFVRNASTDDSNTVMLKKNYIHKECYYQ